MELDVVFRNEEQHKLVGTLAYPEGREPCPGIVICHGFTGGKDLYFYPLLSRALTAAGFAALRFDCRHCGKSEGRFHPTYKTMVSDVLAAMDFLEKQERVTGIGVCGHSMGGTSAIMAAARDGRVGAVVAFAAVAYPGGSVEKKREELAGRPGGTYVLESRGRTFLFDEEFFRDGVSTNPLDAVRGLDAPVLFIHGTADGRVSLDESKQLFLVSRLPKSIKMIEGADHCFTGHDAQLIDATVSFFGRWLLEKEE
ncbi:alpha/beta hydrolase [Candidatus Woesearchaeota archaeon]|nr:alpha/beta hydrolase [Candidatus Woesearchaeota archaeon]